MSDIDFDFKGLENFKDQMEELSKPKHLIPLVDQTVNDMAGVYIREAKQNTPVGPRQIQMLVGHAKGKPRYKTHYINTERMKQSWGMGTPTHKGNLNVSIEVFNTASYASYVNDGHRQKVGQWLPWLGVDEKGIAHGARLKKSWVDGLFIAEHSEEVLEKNATKIMNRAIRKYMSKVFNGNR